MRTRFVLCLFALLFNCAGEERPREEDAKYRKVLVPKNWLSWELNDLRSLVGASGMRVIIRTPSMSTPPAALLQVLPEVVSVRRPDGQYASLVFSSTPNYEVTLDSVFPDPPNLKVGIESGYSGGGWYEAKVDIARLVHLTGLDVSPGDIDANFVGGYLTARFSTGSIPVIRRVVVCPSPAKIKVELSEAAYLTTSAANALLVLDSSGTPITGCPGSGDPVLLDGSGFALSYTCLPSAHLPTTIRVVVPSGTVKSVQSQLSFAAVSGSSFDQLLSIASLPDDGACRYFVPQ